MVMTPAELREYIRCMAENEILCITVEQERMDRKSNVRKQNSRTF